MIYVYAKQGAVHLAHFARSSTCLCGRGIDISGRGRVHMRRGEPAQSTDDATCRRCKERARAFHWAAT